jgi:hypothetical protein
MTMSRKQKETKKDDEYRFEYGTPRKGWLDVGSGFKGSVSMKSQMKYINDEKHVSKKKKFDLFI